MRLKNSEKLIGQISRRGGIPINSCIKSCTFLPGEEVNRGLTWIGFGRL